MLAFTVVGSFWLEIFLKVQVLRKVKRMLVSVFNVAAFFITWDAFAISQKHWRFDSQQILGIFGPFNIPLEEFIFFLVIPIAAIMTIEAVRRVKKNWPIGSPK